MRRKEIAARVDDVGVAKARLPLLTLALLGVLAGAFIGLGALMFTLVASDAAWASRRRGCSAAWCSRSAWFWSPWPAPNCSPATTCWRWPGPAGG